MGKMVMFFAFSWLIVVIAGGVLEGSAPTVATALTSNINTTTTTIPVGSTNGFASTGTLVIDDEHIAYKSKSATAFTGTTFNPLQRGADNTTAAAHLRTVRVRTLESDVLNKADQYNTTILNDVSGPFALIAVPISVFQQIINYIKPPLQFVGTDLQILVYLWGVMVSGLVISIAIYLAGARRIL